MRRKIRRLCLALTFFVALILSAALTQPTVVSALLTSQRNTQSAFGFDNPGAKRDSQQNQPAFQVAEATQTPETVAIETQGQKLPNFVLILVDDSGLMDFSAFGGEARTPNLDQLVENGIWFNNFHTSPVCAPSRAMLITGSDSHLTGVANLPEMLPDGYTDRPGYAGELNGNSNTVATRLKAAGYETYATGKWHLGLSETNLPNAKGFDRSFILGGSGANNYDTRGYVPMKPEAHWYRDGKETDLPQDFYSSKDYIESAIAFHESQSNPNAPFFSYIAFQAIHAPIQAPERFVEPYRAVYKGGWDALRQQRYEKAKALGIIPADAAMNKIFPQFRKWEEVSPELQSEYITDMAVTAGMLEAMDFYIGKYIQYLKDSDRFDNTIFFITSDNGPDGADYRNDIAKVWQKTMGYHKDPDHIGDAGYYGDIGPEFAAALSSPFSFFKYYTGEGGVRTPLIVSGRNIPQGRTSNVFSFVTDVVPTMLDLAGLPSPSRNEDVPITGKSLLGHIQNPKVPVYAEDEGVGLEAANSGAYFLGDYKIVKNNIPLGDSTWHLYHLRTDPGETRDLAEQEPKRFQSMVTAYNAYAQKVGVIEMPEGYSAEGEVTRKSVMYILIHYAPFVLIPLFLLVLLGVLWHRHRQVNALKRKS
ncbi:MAG: sulfatase-like hydrolase/transferase [Cyanobacteriota bacterium]|nr:sulfatase-like hydrolase/transferase [Cyanobacteriota bacterium]